MESRKGVTPRAACPFAAPLPITKLLPIRQVMVSSPLRAATGTVPSARPRPAPVAGATRSELLPVPYFHVVFTLPQQIGRLALQNKPIYDILFRAAAQTLLEVAADPRLLGASIGFLAVLHTWGQNLHLHPHVHCVVPGGGISPDGSRWIACRKDSFFLPDAPAQPALPQEVLAQLRQAFRRGALRFTGQLRRWLIPRHSRPCASRPPKSNGWCTSSLPSADLSACSSIWLATPTAWPSPTSAFALWKTAASVLNGRTTRDRSQQQDHDLGCGRVHAPLLLHVLPSGLVRIRQFGFLANRFRTQKLQLCRTLLAVCQPSTPADSHNPADTTVQDCSSCPICKLGRLIMIEFLHPERPTVPDTS